MFIRYCLGKSLECGKILHVGAPQRLLSPSPLSYFSIQTPSVDPPGESFVRRLARTIPQLATRRNSFKRFDLIN